MRFVITKNIFENVVASMQPFLEKKDSSSITSHIYLEIDNAKLIIKATDYEIGLESHIDNISDMVEGKTTVGGTCRLDFFQIKVYYTVAATSGFFLLMGA